MRGEISEERETCEELARIKTQAPETAPPPGYGLSFPAGLRHRVPATHHLLLSIAAAVPQPAPLPTPKPPDDKPYRGRCLCVKADFAGSAQSPANTAFAARAAIAVTAARWRQRCDGGDHLVHNALAPPPGRLPHLPHVRLRYYPDRFPPSPAISPPPPAGSSVTLGVSGT